MLRCLILQNDLIFQNFSFKNILNQYFRSAYWRWYGWQSSHHLPKRVPERRYSFRWWHQLHKPWYFWKNHSNLQKQVPSKYWSIQCAKNLGMHFFDRTNVHSERTQDKFTAQVYLHALAQFATARNRNFAFTSLRSILYRCDKRKHTNLGMWKCCFWETWIIAALRW